MYIQNTVDGVKFIMTSMDDDFQKAVEVNVGRRS